MTCKSGALTLDGGNFSSTLVPRLEPLLTSKTLTEFLTLTRRTLKANQLEYSTIMEESTKDGASFMLIRDQRLRPRDLMRNSVSTSTDHSTWFLNFHSTELLRCLVEPTWFSRDGETMLDNNNSGSMKSQRLSETT
jgi:hypothetical protein